MPHSRLIRCRWKTKARRAREPGADILAVTAEEQGLWGSAYYAANPVFPKEKTVANINMDGINPYGRMRDIVLVGKGQSEMEELLAEEAEKGDKLALHIVDNDMLNGEVIRLDGAAILPPK
jgi:Zn-dependent M28 family amino/carboxypeptidase